jgi:hypothetical protein
MEREFPGRVAPRGASGEGQGMPFELLRQECDGYLCFAVRGPTTVQNLLAMADMLRQEVDLSGIHSILLACGEMTGGVSLAELFHIGQYYGEHLSDVKLAAIEMPAGWRNNQFSEDVVYLRGGSLAHFDSREEAEAWLRS